MSRVVARARPAESPESCRFGIPLGNMLGDEGAVGAGVSEKETIPTCRGAGDGRSEDPFTDEDNVPGAPRGVDSLCPSTWLRALAALLIIVERASPECWRCGRLNGSGTSSCLVGFEVGASGRGIQSIASIAGEGSVKVVLASSKMRPLRDD